jgi:hypothetical protein
MIILKDSGDAFPIPSICTEVEKMIEEEEDTEEEDWDEEEDFEEEEW